MAKQNDAGVYQKENGYWEYKGMSEADLARAIGTSPQAFNQRMKTGKFTSEDMEKIAQAIGAEYFFGFKFEDGTQV